MANLLSTLFRRSSSAVEVSRFNLSWYIKQRVQAIESGLFPGFPVAPPTVSGRRVEQVENSYIGYVTGAYKADSVVAACMRVRRDIFRQARFCWREVNDNGPGRQFRDNGLGLLERPWPNGTTGELLTRMITDVDLCGNSYVVNEEGDRLRWLRPDWVSIVLSGDPELEPDVDVKGYIYAPGGKDLENGTVYTPDEVCHWAPIQDPAAQYRGMSWLTAATREVQADLAATEHKLAFFRNGATLGPIVKVPAGVTTEQFREFVRAAEEAHAGAANAYRPFYIGGGVDVTLQAATMQQLEFKATQGAGETRIAALAGVHPVLVGLSEGLAGSSLNAGNFNSARRSTADITMWPLWQDVCGALSTFVDVPDGSELWIRDREIPFLREDAKDQAEITKTRMLTVEAGIRAGFKPDALVAMADTNDVTALEGQHTNLFSVQLQPAGEKQGDGSDTRPAIRATATVGYPDDDDDDLDLATLALITAMDEVERYPKDASRAADWDPTEHPRGRDGRFIKLVDRLINALQKHLDSGGDDDDTFDFPGFDREQLRKVAKERGIDLPRGASREHIRDLLLADLKAKLGRKPDVDRPDVDRPKAVKAPRKSGLPTDRRPARGDFQDLAERLFRQKTEEGKLELLQDLNKAELAAVARQYPGDAISVPGWNKVSDRRVGLKLPEGMSLDEQKRWLAKRLSADLPAKKAAPNLEEQARLRQRDIDAAKSVADALAEVDELLANDASDRALRQRLGSMGRRHGIPDDLQRDLVDAAGDRKKLAAIVDRAGKDRNLTRVGKAGDVDRFDAKVHEPVGGGTVEPGDPVRVVRPGYRYSRDGEDIQLSKAGVFKADAPKTPRKRTPKAADPRAELHDRLGFTPRQRQIDADIRAAYQRAIARPSPPDEGPVLQAGRKNGRIPLSDLREELGGKYSRAEVDDVLRRLARGDGDPGFHVDPQSAQWELQPRHREGALRIGGQDANMITLDESARAGNKAVDRPKTPRKRAPAKKTPSGAGDNVTTRPISWPSGGTHLAVEHKGDDVGSIHENPDGKWTAFPPPGAEWGLQEDNLGSGENFKTKDQAIQGLVDAQRKFAAQPPKSAQERARDHVQRVVPQPPEGPRGRILGALRPGVVHALDRQADITPRALLKLQGVEYPDPKTDAGRRLLDAGADAEYLRFAQKIRMSPAWRDNTVRVMDSTMAAHANGHLTPSGVPGVGSTVAHEFGHHIEDLIHGRWDDPDVGGEFFPVMERVLGMKPGTLWTRKRGLDYDRLDDALLEHYEAVRDKVSKYASENFFEFIAEVWQEYSTMGPQAREHIVELGKILARHAEEAAK